LFKRPVTAVSSLSKILSDNSSISAIGSLKKSKISPNENEGIGSAEANIPNI